MFVLVAVVVVVGVFVVVVYVILIIIPVQPSDSVVVEVMFHIVLLSPVVALLTFGDKFLPLLPEQLE